jgi:tRNA(Ile)-lysidine synthase
VERLPYLTRVTQSTKAGGASRVRRAVQAVPPGRYLLAVSGGRDSMALLDAWTSSRDDAVAVASFDHGTGAAATRAVQLVERECERRGIGVLLGSGRGPEPRAKARRRVLVPLAAPSEEALRYSRWEFLNGWAREVGATIVTAHTEDDQVETVFMRVLRGAGARGLAAMYAPSPIVRPLLGVTRADVDAYVRETGVKYVDDPSNASLAYFRNRVRHELLPAIREVHPRFDAQLLDIARRAAEWRRELADLIDGSASAVAVQGQASVPADFMAGLTEEGLQAAWPEVAGRAGVVLDWRGLERLVAETRKVKPGAKIPLSGGATVHRTATTFVVRNSRRPVPLY